MKTPFCGYTSECGGDLIQTMQRMTIPIRREHSVQWAAGIPYATQVKSLEIRGIIIPISGKELLLVPEGDRYRQNVWVYTQGDLQDNDVALYDGMTFQVQTVQNWGSYRQARAMRIDVGPEKSLP